MPIFKGKHYPLNLEFDQWIHLTGNYDVSGEAYILAQKVWEYLRPTPTEEDE
jgi:hypothetical protein